MPRLILSDGNIRWKSEEVAVSYLKRNSPSFSTNPRAGPSSLNWSVRETSEVDGVKNHMVNLSIQREHWFLILAIPVQPRFYRFAMQGYLNTQPRDFAKRTTVDARMIGNLRRVYSTTDSSLKFKHLSSSKDRIGPLKLFSLEILRLGVQHGSDSRIYDPVVRST